MNITVELTPIEVLVIAVAIAATPEGPKEIEDAISSLTRKLLDASDLASIPTVETL